MTLPPFGPSNSDDAVEEAAFEPDRLDLAPPPLEITAVLPQLTEDGGLPSWTSNPSDAELRLRGVLRDIRAEAQSLLRDFTDIRAYAQGVDPIVQEQEVRAAIEQAETRMRSDAARIDKLLLDARELLDHYGVLYDWTGDEVTHIENAWQRVEVPTSHVAIADGYLIRLLPVLDSSLKSLNDLILHCALVTVPTRLNSHLRSLRVGGALSFAATFADELPEKEHQQKLLTYLVAHPASVDGVVDVPNELVYRAARSPRRRFMSFALILACALVGLPLIVILTHLGSWFGLEDWPVPSSRLSELLVAYLFLCVGAMLHLLIGTLKRTRDQGSRTSLVLGDLILWLHVREVTIGLGLLSLPLAITALAFSLDDVGWETAFFVGYSIDSFLDLFLDRFAATGAAKKTQIEDALKA